MPAAAAVAALVGLGRGPARRHPSRGRAAPARGTRDPDGDSLSYFWFHYPEAGSYHGVVEITGAENAVGAWVEKAPVVKKPETLHFILRVTDKGDPPLSRYQRIFVTVVP